MKKIGIVCCSNGRKRTSVKEIRYLKSILLSIGIFPVFSDCIYSGVNDINANAKERALALMKFYMDDEIEGIFDISGGDIANGILPYLDYKTIADSSKIFWGYSDLTTVINAVYAKTGRESVLYQIRNLMYDDGEEQKKRFFNSVIEGGNDLFRICYHFIQGKEMKGVVVGGNIRCFLKLAGTEFMPDLKGKILLLESLHGTAPRIETYLCQLQQLGIFEKAAGILIGTFTQMEKENCIPTVETLLRETAGRDIPIAATGDIGHGMDAKAIIIGQELYLG